MWVRVGCATIAGQVALAWMMEHPLATPLAALAAAILLALAPPARTSRVAWLSRLGVAIGLALAAWIFRTPVDPDSIAVVPVSWTAWAADVLLAVQAASLVAASERGRRVASLVFLACAATAVACLLNQPMTLSQRPFLLVMAVSAAGGLTWAASLRGESLSEASGRQPSPKSERRGASTVLIAPVLAVALGAWSLASAWETVVREAQTLIPQWIEEAESNDRVIVSQFVRGGDLRSVVNAKSTKPMQVALRVYAERTPGYLRGNVFDVFYNGRWRASNERRGRNFTDLIQRPRLQRPTAGLPEASATESYFDLTPTAPIGSSRWNEFEVRHDPDRVGDIYFVPLHTRFLRGQGRYAATDSFGVVRRGPRTSEPYTAYVSSDGPAARQEPDALLERLARPLDGLHPEVEALAATLTRDAQTSADKMEAIKTFLQSEFEYIEEPRRAPGDQEPISFFLMNREPAHCEFFASAAVALLRYSGVPCRYVTGYVCDELEDEYYDFWLARNRDAHAWVEAYDRERSMWVIVEATPGVNLMELDRELDSEDDGGDGNDARAVVQRNVQSLLGWLGELPLGWRWFLSWTPYLTLAAASVWLFRLWRGETRSGRRTESPLVVRMQHALARLEGDLRRLHLRRAPSESLQRFADRVQSSRAEPEPFLLRSADWLRAYARWRYTGSDDNGPGRPPRRGADRA